MPQKKWCLIGLAVVLGLCLWAFTPASLTPAEEYAKATFTRPKRLASSSESFAIFIDGVDALANVPTVASHQKVMIGVVLPPGDVTRECEVILVVPRLPSQDPEGFEWMDFKCDPILALNKPVPTTLGDGRQFYSHTTFSLRPGEYMVRYYRQIIQGDPEKGPPRNEFVGQGRLLVTESESTEPTFVPLEDKKNSVRLYQPDNED